MFFFFAWSSFFDRSGVLLTLLENLAFLSLSLSGITYLANFTGVSKDSSRSESELRGELTEVGESDHYFSFM